MDHVLEHGLKISVLTKAKKTYVGTYENTAINVFHQCIITVNDGK